jgi:hypothetical protein
MAGLRRPAISKGSKLEMFINLSIKEIVFLTLLFIIDICLLWLELNILGHFTNTASLFDQSYNYLFFLHLALLNTTSIYGIFRDAKHRKVRNQFTYGFLMLAVLMPFITELLIWRALRPALPSDLIQLREKIVKERIHKETLDNILDKMSF